MSPGIKDRKKAVIPWNNIRKIRCERYTARKINRVSSRLPASFEQKNWDIKSDPYSVSPPG